MAYLGETESVLHSTISAGEYLTVHQLAEVLGNALDTKDIYTHNHSNQVAVISYLIALAMGIEPKAAHLIHIGGHLHDIGKIGIPDSILKKAGRLTDAEWEWIRMHPEIGANMVRPVDFLVESGIMHMILYHHERYDGKGYPHGLSGRKIPIGARIIAVADTLSALIQDRPYRKRKGFDEAAAEIFRCSGTQFDPMVIGGFLDAQGKIREWLE